MSVRVTFSQYHPHLLISQSVRFIHPSDPQWDKGRNNPEKSFYNDTKSDKSKAKPKIKPKASSTSPVPRGPRSSPLVPQYDLFKRNQSVLDNKERGRNHEVKPIERDRRDRDCDYWDRSVRERDRSRDVRRSSRDRHDENKRPHSSKRSKKSEGVSISFRAPWTTSSKLTYTSRQSGLRLWTRVKIARAVVATAKTAGIRYR